MKFRLCLVVSSLANLRTRVEALLARASLLQGYIHHSLVYNLYKSVYHAYYTLPGPALTRRRVHSRRCTYYRLNECARYPELLQQSSIAALITSAAARITRALL